MSHSGNCINCGDYLEKDLTCSRCKPTVISDNLYPDLPKEISDKVQKMDNVSMVEVEKMVYEYHQNNYEKSLGRKKIRKCSNKKYVKRKKAKNGRRSSKR